MSLTHVVLAFFLNSPHRKDAETWTGAPVEFHFANILSPWNRRALVAGGFGIATSERRIIAEVAPVFTHHLSRGGSTYEADNMAGTSHYEPDPDPETAGKSFTDDESTVSHVGPVVSTDTPFFHLDLTSAVRAAEQAVS